MNDDFYLIDFEFIYRQFTQLFFSQIGKKKASKMILDITSVISRRSFCLEDFKEGETRALADFVMYYLLSMGFLKACDYDPHPEDSLSSKHPSIEQEQRILQSLNGEGSIEKHILVKEH